MDVYPRPQLRRAQWQNLNGLWQYAITDRMSGQPRSFSETIVVPFAIESKLSGVSGALLPDQRLWYRRIFTTATPDVEERERQAEVDQAVNNLRRIGIIQDGVPYQVVPSDVEQLAMVSVSSQQAAAILCGVPGSLRDAIDNPQGPQA